MKHVFLILVIITTPLLTISQELPEILTTKQFERGIYKGFGEFLSNSPSIKDGFKIITEPGDRKIENDKEVYKLIADSAYSKKDIKGFWGVCDGQDIYVSEQTYLGKLIFRKILGLGRYCFFYGTTYSQIPVPAPSITGLIAVPAKHIEPIILNINNGKFYVLSKDILRTILEKDTELIKQYEKEKTKGDDLIKLSYIKQYNTKHSNEAILDTRLSIEVTLYRPQKKENFTPILISINDSAEFELPSNSFYTTNVQKSIVKLCINNVCEKVWLNKKEKNYFELIWEDDFKTPDLLKVDSDVGEFYLREIKSSVKKTISNR
jgi:hypothetical protein